jgi:hypothetical protein
LFGTLLNVHERCDVLYNVQVLFHPIIGRLGSCIYL